MKRKTVYIKTLIILTVLAVIMNLLSFIHCFCDWYVLNIYRRISDVLTAVTSPVPFSAGEILMFIAMAAVTAALILSVMLIFLKKRERFRNFTVSYLKTLLMILVITVNIYTFNWMIPFRTTPLTFGVPDERKYSFDELLILRNYLADKVNEACWSVERDENGFPVVHDDLVPYLKKGAEKISSEFPPAAGSCPAAKQLICSPFLEWMGIGGFTFPYTMEIALNRYTDELYRPSLEAHELAHHLGYYRENEGNFFEYLICMNSEDSFLQYSASRDAFRYADESFYESLEASGRTDSFDWSQVHELDEQNYLDSAYFYGLSSEVYNEEVSEIAEDIFMEASSSVAEIGWETQSELLQDAVYDGVVELLLKYYDGKLY